jgi:purine-binding chemotaxis protein CheW
VSVLARRRAERDKNLVGFTLDGVRYAVEIMQVREIIRPLPVVPIPHPPPAVLGVADHRGEVVPVLDVRARFGLAPQAPTRRTKWIVTQHEARLLGLVVDSVTEVFGASEQEQRAVPKLGAADAPQPIRAVYAHGGSLVFVLDVPQVTAVTEELDLSGLEVTSRGGE